MAIRIAPKQKPDYEASQQRYLAENIHKPPVAFEYEQYKRQTEKRAGRKPSGKVVVSLRLDPDVIEAWRATGPGYQARMNEALKKEMP